MLPRVFPLLPKHQHCKISYGSLLRHLDTNVIKQIQNFEIVMGIGGAISSIPTCERCTLGKHQVSSFPFKSDSQSIELLELIHTNFSNPMETLTQGDAKYFLIFIDDYSWFTIFYFIH